MNHVHFVASQFVTNFLEFYKLKLLCILLIKNTLNPINHSCSSQNKKSLILLGTQKAQSRAGCSFKITDQVILSVKN